MKIIDWIKQNWQLKLLALLLTLFLWGVLHLTPPTAGVSPWGGTPAPSRTGR